VSDTTLGHVPVPEHVEPLLAEPGKIRLGVGVLPEHRRTEVVLDAGPMLMADDRQEEATGTQRGEDARQEIALVLEWDVNQGVEADDRFEALGFEHEVDDVAADEGRLRHEQSCTLDLDRRDVDARDVQAYVDHEPICRDSRAASDIQHACTDVESRREVVDPGPVGRRRFRTARARSAEVRPVFERDRVVAPTHQVSLRGA
jgi:hypothetical protein